MKRSEIRVVGFCVALFSTAGLMLPACSSRFSTCTATRTCPISNGGGAGDSGAGSGGQAGDPDDSAGASGATAGESESSGGASGATAGEPEGGSAGATSAIAGEAEGGDGGEGGSSETTGIPGPGGQGGEGSGDPTPPTYPLNRVYDPTNSLLGTACTTNAGKVTKMTSKCSGLPSTCGYLYCI